MGDGTDEVVPEDVLAERRRKVEAMQRSSGGGGDDGGDEMVSGQVSYFGTEQTFKCVLPDKVSYIEHRTFTEGMRKAYLSKTNRDLRLQGRTGDAFLKTTPGEDRHALLRTAICGWNLLGPNSEPLMFSDRNLSTILNSFPPEIIDLVEKDIRDHNKWMQSEMTLEDIDKAIEEMQEIRATKVQELEGKVDSKTS